MADASRCNVVEDEAAKQATEAASASRPLVSWGAWCKGWALMQIVRMVPVNQLCQLRHRDQQ